MAAVVFFRAVNVGGHQRFQPAKLARELAAFNVINIGAAGTFVVRGNVTQSRLRDEILRRLPFHPELMICTAQDILALARGNWFHNAPAGDDVGRLVTVLQKAPGVKPPARIEHPIGDNWEVRVVGNTGRFVMSIRRPGPKGIYSNAVIEKALGIPATTRNWSTLEAIWKLLQTPPATQP